MAAKQRVPPLAFGRISWLAVWVPVIWAAAEDLDTESDPALMRFVELIHLCSLASSWL